MSSTPGRRRFWRGGQPRDSAEHGAAESIAALQAELVLLREENASLKADQHQLPDLGGLMRRARSLHPTTGNGHNEDADVADESAELMVESLVLRESLLEVCQELQRSIAAVEARLRALAPGGAAANGELGPDEIAVRRAFAETQEGSDGAGRG
jgi:hypothetical protein